MYMVTLKNILWIMSHFEEQIITGMSDMWTPG